MPDLEKVVTGLEKCIADEYCDDCPYTDDCFEIDEKPYREQLMRDALELLKEQEAVKIEVKKINSSGRCGRCPNCLIELNEMDYPNYCGFCGRSVKWNA